MKNHNRIVVLACLAIVAQSGVSCKGSDTNAVTIRRSTSISVAESESAFVAYPSQLAISATGTFAVSDIQRGVLMLYARDGHLLRQIGKRGDGPGELRAPSWLAFSDSSIVVANLPRMRLLEYGTRDGNILREIPVPMRTGSMIFERGHLLAATLPDSTGKNLYRWESLADSSPTRLGWAPQVFRSVPKLAEVFGSLAAAPVARGLWYAFETTNWVYLVDTAGGLVDSVRSIPTHRHGADEEAFRRSANDPASVQRLVYKNSIPIAIAVHSDSALSVVYADVERKGSRFATDYWVSTLDIASRRSCPDRRLDVERDPRAVIAVRGDSIFAFEQVVDDAGKPSTRFSTFKIRQACRE
jgi:hypothetical protein